MVLLDKFHTMLKKSSVIVISGKWQFSVSVWLGILQWESHVGACAWSIQLCLSNTTYRQGAIRHSRSTTVIFISEHLMTMTDILSYNLA